MSRRAALAGGVVTAIVLAGGLGVAGADLRSVPNNSVTSLKILDNSVQSIDIKNGTVAGIDLATGAVASVDIANDAVTGTDIAFNTVESSDIADATIDYYDIADGAVGSTQIADGSLINSDFYPGVLPRFAHVDGGSTASILDSTAFSGIDAYRESPGVYRVSFAGDVSNCGWTATRTDNANNPATPGFITVELGATNTVLRVRTYDTTGAAADTADDEGFSVMVSC
jgi:hypothetical protein